MTNFRGWATRQTGCAIAEGRQLTESTRSHNGKVAGLENTTFCALLLVRTVGQSIRFWEGEALPLRKVEIAATVL